MESKILFITILVAVHLISCITSFDIYTCHSDQDVLDKLNTFDVSSDYYISIIVVASNTNNHNPLTNAAKKSEIENFCRNNVISCLLVVPADMCNTTENVLNSTYGDIRDKKYPSIFMLKKLHLVPGKRIYVSEQNFEQSLDDAKGFKIGKKTKGLQQFKTLLNKACFDQKKLAKISHKDGDYSGSTSSNRPRQPQMVPSLVNLGEIQTGYAQIIRQSPTWADNPATNWPATIPYAPQMVPSLENTGNTRTGGGGGQIIRPLATRASNPVSAPPTTVPESRWTAFNAVRSTAGTSSTTTAPKQTSIITPRIPSQKFDVSEYLANPKQAMSHNQGNAQSAVNYRTSTSEQNMYPSRNVEPQTLNLAVNLERQHVNPNYDKSYSHFTPSQSSGWEFLTTHDDSQRRKRERSSSSNSSSTTARIERETMKYF